MGAKLALGCCPYIAVALAVASWPSGPSGQAPQAQKPAVRYDCGTLALHALLAVEGRPAPLDTLKLRLGAGAPNGHSMAELRHAAGAFGVALTGVTLARSGRAPDRPALVFVRRGDHGHFLVIRPVGHSGRLIQVIDADTDPIVMEAAEFCASPQWTGLALVPRRRAWAYPVAAGVLVGASSVCGLYMLGRLRRPRYRHATANSPGGQT